MPATALGQLKSRARNCILISHTRAISSYLPEHTGGQSGRVTGNSIRSCALTPASPGRQAPLTGLNNSTLTEALTVITVPSQLLFTSSAIWRSRYSIPQMHLSILFLSKAEMASICCLTPQVNPTARAGQARARMSLPQVARPLAWPLTCCLPGHTGAGGWDW